jgi:hypothetical protein
MVGALPNLANQPLLWASAPTRRALIAYHEEQLRERFVMTDVFVYHFVRHSGPDAKGVLSKRRATLETIRDKGEAVMESRRIVDHTEVDRNGFVIGGASNASHSLDELWPQIRSLELRAKSRDDDALKIVEGAENRERLRLESLELRNQARILKTRIEGVRAENLRNQDPEGEPVSYWPPRAELG